jgi:aspartate dehydrogenase
VTIAVTAIPKVAIIGYGAISTELLATLERLNLADRVTGILDLPDRILDVRRAARDRFPVVATLDELLDTQPFVIVECAGQRAVKEFGAAVLRAKVDFMIASVGALADAALSSQLLEAARSGARVLIPSGAVAGIDGILAARTAGLATVIYSSLKPPVAWQGTLAEKLLKLDAQMSAVTFFDGSAREAALEFPQNANVGATIALAGIGLDKTRVKLIADPAVPSPLGVIEAAGDFGTFRFEILAYASSTNPKTSLLTAHSIALALCNGWAFSALETLAS